MVEDEPFFLRDFEDGRLGLDQLWLDVLLLSLPNENLRLDFVSLRSESDLSLDDLVVNLQIFHKDMLVLPDQDSLPDIFLSQ